MGLLPTFYAHWRLNAVLRSWKTVNKICAKLLAFSSKYATDTHRVALIESFEVLRRHLDLVLKDYEDAVLAELKERL